MSVTNASEVRSELENLLSNPTNDVNWVRYASSYLKEHKDLLGGHIHEEDSPGNYGIREKDGQVLMLGYDAQGAEHVLTSCNLISPH